MLALGSVAAALLTLHCRTPTDPPDGPPVTQPEPDPDPEPEPEPAAGPTPSIDGAFEDWSDELRLSTDPIGDATGAFDVSALYAVAWGPELYVRFSTSTHLNLYNGLPDDGTLVLGVELEDGRAMRLDFRERDVAVDGDPALGWTDLGLVAAPSHASTDFELRLDLSQLGVDDGERLALWLEGSDTVAPMEITVGPAVPVKKVPFDVTLEEGAFRIASLNTHESGLVDPSRGAALGRLLEAVEADVYCLQELGGMTDEQIASSVASALGDDAAEWNVRSYGYGQYVKSAVVSRSPLLPIPTTSAARFAGAVVLLDQGPVAVFSVHLKCCGFIGSDEDWSRLEEADLVRRTITNLRDGSLGAEWAEYVNAPVVVVGDFNDVGTPQLQDIFAGQPHQLTRVQPPHASGRDVFSWREPSSGFPPAVLDRAFYDRLVLSRGFLLDSATLDAATLDDTGLDVADSAASDHLLLVSDFIRAR